MKKLTQLLFVFIILFAACDKEETPELKNLMTFDNAQFTIKSGVIETSHWNQDRTTFHILLIDTELSKQNYLEHNMEAVKGASFINFDLDSTYNNFDYRLEGNNCYEATWDFPGMITIDFDADKELLTHELNSGNFCISKAGEIFDVEFNGTTTTGKNVSLYYSGKLIEIEVFE